MLPGLVQGVKRQWDPPKIPQYPPPPIPAAPQGRVLVSCCAVMQPPLIIDIKSTR